MIRFTVYHEDRPATDWPLDGAHLLGPGDLPHPGSIKLEDGHLVCRKRGVQASAVCVPFDTGRLGRLLLQTCLLPDRDEPYVLSVELARHRIKMFIAKSEEWQMFDLSADHAAIRHWETARGLLTEALTADDPVSADRAARASLAEAVEASERLAMAHAEILLHRRYAGRAASSTTLGVRVWPGRDGKPLRELISANFDLLVLPLCWRDIEVEEGKYRWDPIDRWVEWARSAGKPVVAGPLLDFSRAAMPEWMYVWQHDYPTCRDLVYEYMERVVNRYKTAVGMWNIASGLNLNENFAFTPAQMLDLVRTASLLVKHARRGASAMVELRQPFGAHAARPAGNDGKQESMLPFAFADRLLSEGVKIDALGVQVLMGDGGEGRGCRDLMQVSSMLDQFHLLELPILLSAVGVPSAPGPDGAGWWRSAWSPDLQSRWISRMFAVGLSKPHIESLFWTDLYDHPGAELAHGGLIDEEGQPKAALKRLVGMRRRLRRPLGATGAPAAS